MNIISFKNMSFEFIGLYSTKSSSSVITDEDAEKCKYKDVNCVYYETFPAHNYLFNFFIWFLSVFPLTHLFVSVLIQLYLYKEKDRLHFKRMSIRRHPSINAYVIVYKNSMTFVHNYVTQ